MSKVKERTIITDAKTIDDLKKFVVKYRKANSPEEAAWNSYRKWLNIYRMVKNTNILTKKNTMRHNSFPIYGSDCALCMYYIDDRCSGCPIARHPNEERNCNRENSPYHNAICELETKSSISGNNKFPAMSAFIRLLLNIYIEECKMERRRGK